VHDRPLETPLGDDPEYRHEQIGGEMRPAFSYCRLLATDLTDLERQYLHKRIAEEHAQLERLEKMPDLSVPGRYSAIIRYKT
jgi:hypothetical protein